MPPTRIELAYITHDESSVLKWIEGLKPYMPFAQLGWEGCVDQATLACAIVDIASNYGELRLVPSAFPDEYALLADVACMTRAIRKEDVHLAGAVVRALRSFGSRRRWQGQTGLRVYHVSTNDGRG